jgi:hypothetical protein
MTDDEYARGYEQAKGFYLRKALTAQAEAERLRMVLERIEALSWEMSPEQGRRLREVLSR